MQVHEVDPFTDEVNFDKPEDSSPPLSYEVYMTSFKTGEQGTPVKIFIPYVLWEKFTEADKKLIIEYNKRIPEKPANHGQKLASPLPFKPMTTQVQAKVHELDPEHSPPGRLYTFWGPRFTP